MSIKIDVREHELIKTCKYYLEISPAYKDIKFTTEALPIGDIIISDTGEDNCKDNGNGKDIDNNSVIIERKSLRDLAASIKDGRYEEQSYRLNGSPYHNHNIIYLIEGDMNRINVFKDKLDKTTLYSAMVSLNYFKGFSVLRSLSIDETAIIICNMAYKLRKGRLENKTAHYSNHKETLENQKQEENLEKQKEETDLEKDLEKDLDKDLDKDLEKDYCFVVKKVKKDNITPNNIGEILLSQIPGISSVSALAIMAKFKTLPNLIVQLKENESCLQNITYINSKNQTRKINKTIVTNIIKFLKS